MPDKQLFTFRVPVGVAAIVTVTGAFAACAAVAEMATASESAAAIFRIARFSPAENGRKRRLYAAFTSPCAARSSMKNVDPRPGSDSTQIWPPM
jgi:hypothetical protein